MSLDPITALLDVGKMAINRIWPDPAKQAEEERRLIELAQKGDLAAMNAEVQLLLGQIEINKAEANHKSIFVAGWRPFVGWIGGLAFAYASILEPLMRFVATVSGYDGEFPIIDTNMTMQVLLGMLGLGLMRSYEKKNGVHKDSLK
jgi:hypothetical protein